MSSPLPSWAALAERLATAWSKLDREAAETLARFEQVEERPRAARSLTLWLSDVEQAPPGHVEDALRSSPARCERIYSEIPDARNADARLTVPALVDGPRGFLAQTSASSYAE